MAEMGFEMVWNVSNGYRALPSWTDPWPSPFHRAVAESGYGGLGVDLEHFASLWIAVPIFFAFFVVGLVLKKVVFPFVGRALGIPVANKKKQRKFSNQMWLFLFYVGNTYFGYLVQKNKPWWGFPMSTDNMIGFFHDFPAKPDDLMLLYYAVGLAFYTSEIFSLFFETRRSDFYEYLAHHIATIILIAMSFAGRDHNMGSHIIFIHDASDIFLTLAKSAHYVNYQLIVNVSFVLFTAGFIFFRLVCLPMFLYVCFYVTPLVRKATVNFFTLAFLLMFVLQLLHVYWFALIVKTIFRLIVGKKGDTRSDSDVDDAPKKKKERRGEPEKKKI